mmetsp:Transcript_28890/g.93127  ORF Transcript_28890/g.93127 Transcript_28890/m.93127 type:complete len:466 (+) Transcript_28890:49-1446(+)
MLPRGGLGRTTSRRRSGGSPSLRSYRRRLCCFPRLVVVLRVVVGEALPTRGTFDCSTALPNYFGCRGLYASNATLLESFRSSPLVFVHIPKAGGSTVEALLKEYAKRVLGLRELAVTRRAALYDWVRRGGQKVHPKTLFDSKHDVDVATFVDPVVVATMLRHPAERILSHYQYVLGTTYPGACTTKTKTTEGTDEDADDDRGTDDRSLGGLPPLPLNRGKGAFASWYAREFPHMPDVNNFEVRLLVSRGEDRRVEETSETSAVLDERACRYRTPLPPVTERHLAFAKNRIAGMSLLGILEHFEETMALWNQSLPGLFENDERHKDLRLCGNKNHRVCGDTAAQLKRHRQTHLNSTLRGGGSEEEHHSRERREKRDHQDDDHTRRRRLTNHSTWSLPEEDKEGPPPEEEEEDRDQEDLIDSFLSIRPTIVQDNWASIALYDFAVDLFHQQASLAAAISSSDPKTPE